MSPVAEQSGRRKYIGKFTHLHSTGRPPSTILGSTSERAEYRAGGSKPIHTYCTLIEHTITGRLGRTRLRRAEIGAHGSPFAAIYRDKRA